MPSPILKFFEYHHLPADLQYVAQQFHFLAQNLDAQVMDSEEKEMGFRKLLEAKDCMVRAALS